MANRKSPRSAAPRRRPAQARLPKAQTRRAASSWTADGTLVPAGIKTVADYLEASVAFPRLQRNTHHYISDMFDHFGREVVFEGIYGLDEQIESLMLFFHAHNTSLERRLLLLVGPQGAGKSFTVDKVKKHLDLYSHTDEGILFGVKGCPFHQHPFDMVPHTARMTLKDSHGFRWFPEAIPCPVCEQAVAKLGDWRLQPIERIYVSSAEKTGLAKHTPTDLRREDITNFIGNINFSKLRKVGSTYAPDAYDFEGKMIWANRGLLDWTEIFKSRRQLLGLLLELIQSKRIDMSNFPTVHVDEVVIGHTNFPEYNVFVSEDIMEPLLGRIFKIEWPYGLDKENEKRIYRKTVERTDHLTRQTKHMAEDTLDFLCEFAVRTRQESHGLQGLSPRFFQDVLARAYTMAKGCIDLEILCDSVLKMFKHKAAKDVDPEKARELFEQVKQEHVNQRIDVFVKHIVPKHFMDYGQNLYLGYLAAAAGKVQGAQLSKTEEKLVDEVEELLVAKEKISPKGRPAFQSILLERRAELEKMPYGQNEQLGETINELVFNKVKGFLRLSTKTEKLDAQSKEIRAILKKSLVADHGYCEKCAEVLFAIVGQHI